MDLVHFTILRPPQKSDNVPTEEIALIAFPKAHGLVLGELYLPVTLMLIGLTWTFGTGPGRQPDRFEFDGAGATPPG